MRKTYVTGGVAVVGVLALGAVFAGQTIVAGSPPPYLDAQTVAKGQELYAEHCAACHGDNLEGQGDWRSRDADGYLPAPPHDATGHTWHHPDAQLLEITKLGTAAIVGGGYQSRMSGFGDQLSDAQIISILAYIKSTWPARVVDIHNRINADAGG
jgi:mono/diheme cytochrome c family protein